MSFLDTLTQKRLGALNYLQWLILLAIFFFIILVVFWFQAEANKEPPKIVEGVADGVFHGKRYGWYANAPITEEYKGRCYNNSYLFFWGNITLSDGTTQDVTSDGRKISGLICKEWADGFIWSSSDKSHRTPIRVRFKGVIDPMPILDLAPYLPYLGWALTFAALIYYVYFRKYKRRRFDAKSAIATFERYRRAKAHRGKGPIEAIASGMSGNAYTVGQEIISSFSRIYLILTVDNHHSISEVRYDDTGDVWREKFGRKGIEFSKEMMLRGAKHGDEETYDLASKMMEDALNDKNRRPAQTSQEKEQEIRRLTAEEAPHRPAFPSPKDELE